MRFGAMAFNRFDQGALLPADVTARADEKLQFKVQIGSEDFFAEEPSFRAAAKLFTENLLL